MNLMTPEFFHQNENFKVDILVGNIYKLFHIHKSEDRIIRYFCNCRL